VAPIFTVRFDFPKELKLIFNEKDMLRQTGKAVETAIKKRWRGGAGASGPLASPLKRSGRLLRSVRMRGLSVRPGGARGDSKLDNFGLLMVHLARGVGDPMGVDADLKKRIHTIAEDNLKKQLRRKQARLRVRT